MFAALLLSLALGSPAQAPRRPVLKHGTQWVDVPTVSAVWGDVEAESISLGALPAGASGAFLEYEIAMPGPALRYAVENLSLVNACEGAVPYNGAFGAAFVFMVGPQVVDGIGYHASMCGGVELTTFDGAVDFLGSNGTPYGGSGHTSGVGFPTYTARVPVSAWALGSAPVLTMSVAPSLSFSHWNGDANWIRGSMIDGSQYSVRARLVWQ